MKSRTFMLILLLIVLMPMGTAGVGHLRRRRML